MRIRRWIRALGREGGREGLLYLRVHLIILAPDHLCRLGVKMSQRLF